MMRQFPEGVAMHVIQLARAGKRCLQDELKRIARILSRPFRTLTQRYEVCRVRALPGLTIHVVLDQASTDPLSQFIRRGVNPNEELMELTRAFTGLGDKVLDLGGHVGLFALSTAALGREVLSVEASPRNAALLALSARLNGFANLHVVNCAVGVRPGLASFCEAGPYGTVANAGLGRSVTARVPMLDIDTLLAAVGWERPAFIKMDIEGCEPDALIGMRRCLQSAAPVLLYESNDYLLHLFGSSTRALHQAVAAEGYRSYQVGQRRLTPSTASEPQGPTCADYLAIKGALRALPSGWAVTGAFTADDLIDQFLACLQGDNADSRASAARRLAGADRRLLTAPAIQTALQRLHHDASDQVRAAAAWHQGRAA